MQLHIRVENDHWKSYEQTTLSFSSKLGFDWKRNAGQEIRGKLEAWNGFIASKNAVCEGMGGLELKVGGFRAINNTQHIFRNEVFEKSKKNFVFSDVEGPNDTA